LQITERWWSPVQDQIYWQHLLPPIPDTEPLFYWQDPAETVTRNVFREAEISVL
jgi:hypothetical protein